MAANGTASFRPDQENVVYIGEGVTLKGELSVPDLLIVDGLVEGAVTARVVWVGRSGVIRGAISAIEADVSGWIGERIDVKQLLVVRATGRIEGDTTYGEIELEKGAVVAGDLTANADHRTAAKPSAGRQVLARPALSRPALAKPLLKPALVTSAVAEFDEEPEEVAAPLDRQAASIVKLNEAVRAAREASAEGRPTLAPGGGSLRRNVLRSPLSSR